MDNRDLDRLAEQFPDEVLDSEVYQGLPQASVRPGRIRDIIAFLKSDAGGGYTMLSDLTCADYLELGDERPARFGVIYQLTAFRRSARIMIRAMVAEEDPTLDSIIPVFAAADWAEREVFDLYGLTFRDHPNLTRILCPDDFEGHPLRKDFPLEGIGYRDRYEVLKD